MKQPIDYFMRHVDFIENGCWNWTGTTKPGGYGVFRSLGKTWNAHRWAYTNLVCGIPATLTIDHLCRNKKCVNPQHMEVVTLIENIMRGEGCSVQNARKTHCPKGHPLINVPETKRTALRRVGTKRYCPICYIQNPLTWNKNNRDRKNKNNRKSYHKRKPVPPTFPNPAVSGTDE